MRCRLLGVERLDYTKKDGKEVKAYNLFVSSENAVNSSRMKGLYVDSKYIPDVLGITNIPDLMLNGVIDISEEIPLGSRYSQIVAVRNVSK